MKTGEKDREKYEEGREGQREIGDDYDHLCRTIRLHA